MTVSRKILSMSAVRDTATVCLALLIQRKAMHTHGIELARHGSQIFAEASASAATGLNVQNESLMQAIDDLNGPIGVDLARRLKFSASPSI